MHPLLTVLAAAYLLLPVVPGQSADPAITTALVTNPRQMTVVFSMPVTGGAGAPHMDRLRVRLLPDNVTPVSIARNALAANTLSLDFEEIPATAARICFDQVAVTAPDGPRESAAQVCADLSRDPASLKNAWVAAFEKVPQRSADRDLFASGFVTSTPDDSAGGADLSLNPRLAIPNLHTFLTIKKATAEEGDARHFEAGARYRYVRSWKRGEIDAIAAETDPGALNALIRERQRNILAGWVFDVAGRLEADPTDFDVTNAVADSSILLQTMTRRLPGRRGFWRAFVMPAGVEAGQTLGSPAAEDAPGEAGEAAPRVNRIARLKAGAGFTLYFDNPAARFGLLRAELDATGVVRHLFLEESRFHEAAGAATGAADGLHGYTQLDLKLFVAETPRGRFGVKVSFNHGRLPPVYARVNSFNFGFVIESGDGNGETPAEARQR